MTVYSRLAQSVLVGVVVGIIPASALGQEKKQSEELVEARVRLKLNALESSKLMERYASLLDRESSLQDSVLVLFLLSLRQVNFSAGAVIAGNQEPNLSAGNQAVVLQTRFADAPPSVRGIWSCR
jgi:hypothetical protein